jgi:cytoskeletal protein CcmA (bactofilin family)/DNA-directed RNA polymerase subunit RPC12/RpoP
MPAKKPAKVLLSCPHCGNQQAEPPSAISSVCKKCGKHFHVQDVLHPAPKEIVRGPDQRRITCFECHAELDIPASAESTMCKRCSHYIDLKDYLITSAVSKNFKTKGAFVVEPKGYVFNTEAVVGDATIKGRFLGKLAAEHSLTIFSTAEIKGSFKTARLIIPKDNHFFWKEPLNVANADIAGELVASLQVTGTVFLRATGRLFGDVVAGNFVVESGAVFVGKTKIGVKT